MPVLKDFRQTKELTLPSYPDSVIVVYDSLLVGDYRGVNVNETNQIEQGIELLPRFIKSWNFTDENEVLLPINKESILFFTANDLQFLMNEIQKFGREVKKN